MFLKKQRGLTLIELLAVIAIIAILFVLLIPQISNAIDKSRKTGILTDFRSFEIAAKTMFMDNLNDHKHAGLMNKNLDESLKIYAGISQKLNPYGEKYLFFPTSKNMVEIRTSDGKDKDISIVIFHDKGETKSYVFGLNLDNEIKKKNLNGMNYFIADDSIIITDYNGNSDTVTIPSQINGVNVKVISSHAFSKMPNHGLNTGATLKNVVIEEGIEFIGESAFRMNAIETLVLPNTLKSLAYATFANNKIHSFTLPNSLEYMAEESFNTNRITSIVFPNTLTYIGEWAFNANLISSATLPSNLKYIGPQAFNNNKLTTITIPSSVEIIKAAAFRSNPMTSHKILGNPIIEFEAIPSSSVPIP